MNSSTQFLAEDARGTSRRGFTIVEMMVSCVVLALLLTILLSATNHATSAVTHASGQIEAFSAARAGLDTMTLSLSQATLNSYLDYYDNSGTSRSGYALAHSGSTQGFVPLRYGRVSDLVFLIRQRGAVGSNSGTGSGQEIYFITPQAYSTHADYQSTQGLLNACGYFIQYGNSGSFSPSLITTGAGRNRYRLMQALQPTETLQIANYLSAQGTNHTGTDPSIWKATPGTGSAGWAESVKASAIPLADNVIAMIIWPRLSASDEAASGAFSQSGAAALSPGSSIGGRAWSGSTSGISDFSYDTQFATLPVAATNSRWAGGGSVYVQYPWVNQLPPRLQVTLVVIDEASAARIESQKNGGPQANEEPSVIVNALAKAPFNMASKFQTDMDALTKELANNHINYRVLTTTIPLRESKWSAQ